LGFWFRLVLAVPAASMIAITDSVLWLSHDSNGVCAAVPAENGNGKAAAIFAVVSGMVA
jgi:hypothetical protein